ncbi:hypothetical protein DFH28DRAFT_174268 [Melampsora americana]|nr:hypothetical protein DFH28DRAFT_174268 [Melampsora americana]
MAQKTSTIHPPTSFERKCYQIPSKDSYNDHYLAYGVFENFQNRNQHEYYPVKRYQHHATSPGFINTQGLLATQVPIVYLPSPDFVLPGMVPCFLNPQDAAQWAASGAELVPPWFSNHSNKKA